MYILTWYSCNARLLKVACKVTFNKLVINKLVQLRSLNIEQVEYEKSCKEVVYSQHHLAVLDLRKGKEFDSLRDYCYTDEEKGLQQRGAHTSPRVFRATRLKSPSKWKPINIFLPRVGKEPHGTSCRWRCAVEEAVVVVVLRLLS